MRLVFISDTHSQLDKINVPEGDLLIHCGDYSYRGTIAETNKFNEDLGKIKHRFTYGVIGTYGNHDWIGQQTPDLAQEILSNIKMLHEKELIINGLKFYGSAWQPEFCNWAFGLPRGEQLRKKWELIPDDVNVLITHTPPKNILDACPDGFRAGCEDLLSRVVNLEHLKIHSFGHIHLCGSQMYESPLGPKYINASVCDESYKPTNKIITVDL